MEIYAIYLRKSRTDEQAEARGEGDTLARHRKTLTELAERDNAIIGHIYEEVGSADSIAARQKMQQLLLDVVSGKWAGVYVMDIDRLSRGDAGDQATVMRAFQSSGTIIRTPGKAYDFNTATDEDQGEFKLFFSHLEYKTIKRRLYRGRELSAEDGWYIGTRKVYGYHKVPAQGKDGPTLAIYPEQAEVVLKSFQLYADGHSSHYIADVLNGRGVKPNYSDYWNPSTIRNMLKNPVYIGLISWGKKVSRPTLDGGKKRILNPRAILSQGRHPAIVPEPLWDAVSARLAGNIKPTTRKGNTVVSPLAGLVRCSRCGYLMQRHSGKRYRDDPRANDPDMLRCQNRQCNQIRSRLDVVEEMILERLDELFSDSRSEASPAQIMRNQERQKAAKLLREQIRQAEAQETRQKELLEQGIYSVEDFLARRKVTSERLLELHRRLDEVTEPDAYEERLAEVRKRIPRSLSITEAYQRCPDAATKNELLHTLVECVEYDKTEPRRGRYDDPRRGLVVDVKLKF